ncbi:hypothetical protein H1R20_g1523, partial [Candolleomyces eurysporus]
MATTSNFNKARNVQIDNYSYNYNDNSVNVNPSADPLSKLEARVAAGAIHDSAERCDAPKCYPETRVAVQANLYCWIVDGDREVEQPKKIKWVTGPAGTGKTAVMGSLADRCAEDGVLGATFFFASWSASIGRRRKTAFVTTIAHQLAQHREDLKNAISAAMEKNPGVLEKKLHVQMETLVLAPLREVVRQSEGPELRGAIIVDGLDECEAEQYHDTKITGPRATPTRTNAQDQLEILQVLQAASLDTNFPFRILIASRPERVFREFFDPEVNPTFAQKLDLNVEHNANADITLFLEAQFDLIRRRFNFPLSWPPPGTIQTLVENASGQFIYAATVIRLFDTGHREAPKALLDAILKMEATRTTTSNPLEQLDALYMRILESSPDPPLSVRWIYAIHLLVQYPINASALKVNMLLQTDPESNEAEHLLGTLHSLIRIPPPSNQTTTQYGFYHKSLLDFLEDPGRCGKLYVEESERCVFIWDPFVRVCARGCDTQFSYPESFLNFLTVLPDSEIGDVGIAHSKVLHTPPSADWNFTVHSGLHEHGPKSFTSEDVLELHVHSGRAVISAALSALSKLPTLRPAEPGEFTRRAYLNGRLDLTQAEGLKDLIDAETEGQRRVAVRAAEGVTKQKFDKLRADIISSLAKVEALIDFGEGEEIEEGVYEDAKLRVQKVLDTIQGYLNDHRRGELLRSGIRLAIFGPPNAGKSSLLNFLAQREAAIVTPIPGTTRDILELSLDIGGLPVVIADTAGLRKTEDVVEKIGIERARKAVESADISICVLSFPEAVQQQQQRNDLGSEASSHWRELISRDNTFFLFNKSDLVDSSPMPSSPSLPSDVETLRLSLLSPEPQHESSIADLDLTITPKLDACPPAATTKAWKASLATGDGAEEFLEGFAEVLRKR